MTRKKPRTWSTRAERRAVELRGFVLADGLDADIAVSDLSYDGCQISCSESLERGDSLELRIIGRGGAKAEVRWTGNGRAGLRFTG